MNSSIMNNAAAGNAGENEWQDAAEHLYDQPSPLTTYPPQPRRPPPMFRPQRPSSSVNSEPLPPPPASSSRRTFGNIKKRIHASPFLPVFEWLYERLRSQITYLTSLHHVLLPLLHPLLLLLPLYYRSKASAMYKDIDTDHYLQDLVDWTRRSRQALVALSPHPSSTDPYIVQAAPTPCTFENHVVYADTVNSAHIVVSDSLSSRCSNFAERGPDVTSIQQQHAMSSVPPHPTPRLSPTVSQLPLPSSIQTLHCAWQVYIKSCLFGWRISFAVAGFLFSTSPVIFQVQAAIDDPVPRTFAFLAVFRAIVGVVYAPVFLYYFSEGSETRSVQFAILWIRETRAQDGRMKWGPWIMLSLPGSAALWAIGLYTLSMLTFMWRVVSAGHSAGPAPLSKPATTALCSVLTAVTVLDVVGGVWTWRKMVWFKREVRKMPRYPDLDA
ncbi:hypothetical protein FPV67DRAFT_1446514 [Lyophyllum atratum]|nr:hypothetical protein FPV67DRAFT_1446514 [Lyophyllum atratum]